MVDFQITKMHQVSQCAAAYGATAFAALGSCKSQTTGKLRTLWPQFFRGTRCLTLQLTEPQKIAKCRFLPLSLHEFATLTANLSQTLRVMIWRHHQAISDLLNVVSAGNHVQIYVDTCSASQKP